MFAISLLNAGTDDDFPPHQYSFPRGSQIAVNGRPTVASAQYSRMHIDMEAQIHQLEKEAYCAVLRAFKAQADAITWVFLFSILHNLLYHYFSY